MSTTDKLTDNQKWSLAGRAPYKFHPQASHVSPDYRDGWNHALDAVEKYAAPAVEVTADAVEIAAKVIVGYWEHYDLPFGKDGPAEHHLRDCIQVETAALVQQVERLKTDLAHWVLKCSAMSADNARLAKDAERYQYARLRYGHLGILPQDFKPEYGAQYDAQIDGAIAAQAKQAEGGACS